MLRICAINFNLNWSTLWRANVTLMGFEEWHVDELKSEDIFSSIMKESNNLNLSENELAINPLKFKGLILFLCTQSILLDDFTMLHSPHFTNGLLHATKYM